jgi:hypothetical protein
MQQRTYDTSSKKIFVSKEVPPIFVDLQVARLGVINYANPPGGKRK